MKRIFTMMVAIPLSIAASGCAGIQAGGSAAGAVLCARADDARTGYLITIQNALFIEDPVTRTMVIGTAQAGLDALARCPNYIPPASTLR